jgi:dihydroneopterin aldolase
MDDGGLAGDRIEVRGLELLVYCGVLPEEQARQQPFRIDLDLHLDLGPAGASDDLDDTVDYGAIADLLARHLGQERFMLLERMAQRTAELIMASAPRVAQVTVRATKMRPPLPVHVDTTGVRIHRRRSG